MIGRLRSLFGKSGKEPDAAAPTAAGAGGMPRLTPSPEDDGGERNGG